MLHQNHLEGLLKHVLLGPTLKVSDSVRERGLEYWHFFASFQGMLMLQGPHFETH